MKNTAYMMSALAAVAAGALASCSDNDMKSVVEEDNAIRFAANTEFSSRDGDVTTGNLTEFNVYAYTGTNTLFMDNVKVTKSASNTWTYSPLQNWPAANVDFYAYYPESWIGTAGVQTPVKYSDKLGKTDLVYAVAADLNGYGVMPSAQVVFNFRHALSKVTVYLSSTNADLKVNVTNVALANIRSAGEFVFPAQSTDGAPTAETVGTWTNLSEVFPYMLHMSQRPDEIVTLTSEPVDLSETGLGGPKFLIPQTLTWRSLGAKDDNYIMLMCSVYDAKTNEKLWPNANTPAENLVEGSSNNDGLLKFPLSTKDFSEWKPGYHYVYNLVVNNIEEIGSIEFGTPTVDTYVDVVNTYK